VTSTPITDALRWAPPGLHGAGEYWGLAWSALTWLERNVRPEWSTLETGAGASTIVFAAAGTAHEAVTPDAGEEERIRGRCTELGVDSGGVTFRIGPSHVVLARWEPRPLDLVLVDGAHGFPYPILDWWHVAPHVRVGGTILLDDAYLPAVSSIVDFTRDNAAWRVDDAVSFRTARLTKLADEEPPFFAGADAARGRMRFAYLPPHRRIVASARQRVFSTRAGLWAVRRLRRGP
jgi:Methyltransferase domain